MSTKISGDTGIDVAQLRPADGDPVAMTIAADGKVAFPQNPVPAFIATVNTQAIAGGVVTILTCTETFDPLNQFADNKFTPQVAGLYQVNANLANNISDNWCGAYLYKNGVQFAINIVPGLPAPLGGSARPCISQLVSMNGTTDYLNVAGYNSIDGFSINSGLFSAALVRAA